MFSSPPTPIPLYQQSFHELNLLSITTPWVSHGHYRDVWKILEDDSGQHPRALKTLQYHHTMDPATMKRHRKDAVAHDVLTSSHYIANIYGYCSNSALHDYSQGGDLSHLFQQGTKPMSKHKLLQLAYRLAASVHDAHHVDDKGQATMVHTDIKPYQWILINGEYQLNDFNRNIFMSWNTALQRTNKFTFTDNGGLWRSPEEYAFANEDEKIDVWSLGNVLYFVLTQGKIPFVTTGVSWNIASVTERVKHGGYPIIKDEQILQSKHTYDVAMLQAMKQCFIADPKKRASSGEIRQIFARALNQLPFETSTSHTDNATNHTTM